MRTTEHASGWEIDGLSRRLDALETRLDRRYSERLQNVMLAFWMLWSGAIGAMIATAVLT